jgi:nucleotide-binding universal stress UspA family protein
MKKLLVAFDGSESATRALRHAIDQVKGKGQMIHLMITYPAPIAFPEIGVTFPYEAMTEAAERETTKVLEPAERMLNTAGVGYTKEVLCGPAGSSIAERADPLGFVGIVMGTRGMGALKGLVMGSVATQVVHLAEVPVTLVK